MTIASRLYPPETSAAGFRIQALAEALRHRAAVSVLTTRPRSFSTRRSESEPVRVRRAPVLRDRSGAIRGYLQYLSFDVPLIFRLLFSGHDVVVAEAPPTTGLVSLLVSRIRRSAFVYYPGDVWSDAMISMGARSIAVSAMRWIESTVARHADRVLAVSPEVASRLEALGADAGRVVVVGNGVDTRVFHADVGLPETDVPYFVYTGTMSEWQDPSIFIRALAELDDPDIHLRFYGQGSEQKRLQALADELVPGRVHFGGLIDPADSARWIRGAMGALVSIVPGIGYDFARPTKTYAAAACGTPVLYTGAKTGGDLVHDNRLGLAVDFTTAEVARAMRTLQEQAMTGDTERFRQDRAHWAVAEASLSAVAQRAAQAVHDAACTGAAEPGR